MNYEESFTMSTTSTKSEWSTVSLIPDACTRVVDLLFQHRNPDTGAWTGRLSSSALSTALAVTALEDGNSKDQEYAARGAQWLVDRINSDGGWGDTPASPSNLSTSLIVRACLTHHRDRMGAGKALTDSGAWIMYETGGLSVKIVSDSLDKIYGDDKTFAVPILMYLAICSGHNEDWLSVPEIPFYLALLPQWCFRFFKLEVVSYALPALIAVGLCCHIRSVEASGNKPRGRRLSKMLLSKLESIQPEHGGFLDAVPLTAFVVLALKNCGYGDCPVVKKGLDFLRRSIRDDYTWPIDSNLRCWLTSLTSRVLSREIARDRDMAAMTVDWLLKQQHTSVHPYTGAKPGGWAWTDLAGGVPDADDTSAALIALFHLKDSTGTETLMKAVCMGINWLMDLQNSDGGMPTFCRGWGRLPFDQSCCDISAHALEALSLWRNFKHSANSIFFDDCFLERIDKSLSRLVSYLKIKQDDCGGWLPLWFGHQQCKEKLNRIIGTARVVAGLHSLKSGDFTGESLMTGIDYMIKRGESLLIKEQKQDGGWSAGHDSTLEETALAVTALARGEPESRAAAVRGAEWISDIVMNNEIISVPIGLYFSVLWYDEKLYPLIWSAAALKAVD